MKKWTALILFATVALSIPASAIAADVKGTVDLSITGEPIDINGSGAADLSVEGSTIEVSGGINVDTKDNGTGNLTGESEGSSGNVGDSVTVDLPDNSGNGTIDTDNTGIGADDGIDRPGEIVVEESTGVIPSAMPKTGGGGASVWTD